MSHLQIINLFEIFINYGLQRKSHFSFSMKILITYLNLIKPKNAEIGQFDTHLSFFQNCIFCIEGVRPCFFVTLSTNWHIFPENVIKIPQVVQKTWRFSSSILANFIKFLDFWDFLVANKLMTSAHNRWYQHFLPSTLL